ncbi:hypothetical protein GCM10010844_35850 [Deinococcus radiotolerans]|uniref:Secreted protein n=1 Tax=Deinococcus radiotolerans TaxID=1309407 RepID=A0ABQ2FPD2_9DEIO|nr:hypothetical protein GCM10010844_35850 [Deinococcus radiotolerans]
MRHGSGCILSAATTLWILMKAQEEWPRSGLTRSTNPTTLGAEDVTADQRWRRGAVSAEHGVLYGV